jgi:uroporphyrinogen decarboxylase
MIHSRTKGKVLFHSCGAITSIIPDLIEIGVDILNPIQTDATGMEPAFLKKEFGEDLCFWGGISTQHLLPFGTPNAIDEEVRMLIDVLGKDGGYVIAPCHNIQAGVPPENLDAMINAIVKYR